MASARRLLILTVALCLCSCYGFRFAALDGLSRERLTEETEQGKADKGSTALKHNKTEADAENHLRTGATYLRMLPFSFFSKLLVPLAVFLSPSPLSVQLLGEAPMAQSSGAASYAYAGSKMPSSRVSLRQDAKRFRDAMQGSDVNVARFFEATREFGNDLERFGPWTKRGIDDARNNMHIVEGVRGKISSMRQLLTDQLNRGARLRSGGPARGSGAEALQWSTRGIRFWVETFKEQLRRKQQMSLRDASGHGFERSMGPYFNGAAKMAVSAGMRSVPDWNEIRQRVAIGCAQDGDCPEDTFWQELEMFVKDVEPVLNRMTEMQKEFGLEDLRTP